MQIPHAWPKDAHEAAERGGAVGAAFVRACLPDVGDALHVCLLPGSRGGGTPSPGPRKASHRARQEAPTGFAKTTFTIWAPSGAGLILCKINRDGSQMFVKLLLIVLKIKYYHV